MLLPFFLHYFNDDVLGLWYIFMSLSNIAALFTFGFSPSFARNIAYCWNGATKLAKTGKIDTPLKQEIDVHLFEIIMHTCRTIYLIIAFFTLIIMLSFGSLYIKRVVRGVMIQHVPIAWWIMIVAIFFNIYLGYYISLLSGIGCIAERSKAQVISGIVRIIFTGLLLALGMDLVGACLAYLIYGFVLRELCRKYFLCTIESNIKDYKKDATITVGEIYECLKTIWSNAWRDGVVSISDYLCTQAGTIVCSLFLTLVETGIYSLSVQLITAIGKIARSFQISYIPELQTAYITNNEKDKREVHSMCISVYCITYIIGICALYAIGLPVLKIIRPGIVMDKTVLLGIATLQFIVILRNCYASYLSTTNRVNYWFAFMLSGCLSVMISVITLQNLKVGVWGIIVPAIGAELMYNCWHWVLIVHKELNISFKDVFRLGLKRLTALIEKK